MRNLTSSPSGAAVIIGNTEEIATTLNGPIRPGRVLINTQTEVTAIQLPGGGIKVLETVSRPTHKDAISKPKITGIEQAPNGYNVILHGGGSIQSFVSPQTEIKYYWYLNKYDLVHVGDSYGFVLEGQIGDIIRVGCRAIDDFGNTSEITYHDITVGELLEVKPFMTDLPRTGVHGQTGTFYIDPGTDIYGNPYTAIVHSSVGLTITGVTTFDRTTWMTYTATSDTSFGGETNNQVELQLEGVTVTNEIVSMFIDEPADNKAPLTGDLVTTFPTQAYSNQKGAFTVSGAVDPEGQAVFYSVTTNDANLTLSDNINVKEFDDISYAINKDPSLPVYTVAIHVVASDIYGKAAVAKSFICEVHTDRGLVFDYDQFVHDLGAQEDTVIPTDHTYGGMTVTVDGTEYPLSYSINSPDITPHPTPDEVGTWHWLAAGTKQVTWTPYIGDLVGNGISVQIEVITSQEPPSLGNLTGIPTEMNINSTGTYQLTGGVDPEGGTLAYGITTQLCMSYGGVTSVANNENFPLSSKSTLGICNVTVIATSSVSGLQTTKVFPVNIVNNYSPPDLSGVTGIPSSVAVNIPYNGTYDGAIDPAGGNLALVWSTNNSGNLTTEPTANNTAISYTGTEITTSATITLVATSDVSTLSTTRVFDVDILNATLNNDGMAIITPTNTTSADLPQSLKVSYTGSLNLVSFDISAAQSNVSIAKETGLVNNEDNTYTMTNDYSTTILFSAVGYDASGASTIPITKIVVYNNKPITSDINLNLVNPLIVNNTYNASITAGSDFNTDEELNYTINSNPIVSHPTGFVTPGVDFTVDALEVGVASITVTVSDQYGSSYKTFNRDVNAGNALPANGLTIDHVDSVVIGDIPSALTINYISQTALSHAEIEISDNTAFETAVPTINIGEATTIILSNTGTGDRSRNFTIRARGVYANGNKTVYISKVVEFNDPPSLAGSTYNLSSTSPIPVGAQVTAVISGASDKNSDELSWEAEVVSGFGSVSIQNSGFQASTSNGLIITATQPGTLTFRYRVQDGPATVNPAVTSSNYYSDWVTQTVTADNVNGAPTGLTIYGADNVWSGTEYSWSHSAATDADGDPITYKYSAYSSNANQLYGFESESNIVSSPNVGYNATALPWGPSGSYNRGSIRVTASDDQGNAQVVDKTINIKDARIGSGEFTLELTTSSNCSNVTARLVAATGVDATKVDHWTITDVTFLDSDNNIPQAIWYTYPTTNNVNDATVDIQPTADCQSGVGGRLIVNVTIYSVESSGNFLQITGQLLYDASDLGLPTLWVISNPFINTAATVREQYFTGVDYDHQIPVAESGETTDLVIEVTASNEPNLVGTYPLGSTHTQDRSPYANNLDYILYIDYRLRNTVTGATGLIKHTTWSIWKDDMVDLYNSPYGLLDTFQYGDVEGTWKYSIFNGSDFSVPMHNPYPITRMVHNTYYDKLSNIPASAWYVQVEPRTGLCFVGDDTWTPTAPKVNVVDTHWNNSGTRAATGIHSSKYIELHAAPFFLYPPSNVYTINPITSIGQVQTRINMPSIAWVMIEVPHSLFKWYDIRLKLGTSYYNQYTNTTTLSGGHARVLFRIAHGGSSAAILELQAKRRSVDTWATTDIIGVNCMTFTAASTLDWNDDYTTYVANQTNGTILSGQALSNVEANTDYKYRLNYKVAHNVRSDTSTHLLNMVYEHYSCGVPDIECNGIKPVYTNGVFTWTIVGSGLTSLNFMLQATGTASLFHRHTIVSMDAAAPYIMQDNLNDSVHLSRANGTSDIWAPVITYWDTAQHSSYPNDTGMVLTIPAAPYFGMFDVFVQNGVESVKCSIILTTP